MKPIIVSIIKVTCVLLVCAMNVVSTDAQMLTSFAQHSSGNEEGVLIAVVKKKKTSAKKSATTNSKNKARTKSSNPATNKQEGKTNIEPIATKDEPATKQVKIEDNENDDKNFFSKAKDKISGFFKGDDKDSKKNDKKKYKYDKNTSIQELFDMAHELVKEVDVHENTILSLPMDTKEDKKLIKKERDAAHEKRKKAVKIYSEIIKREPIMGAYLGRGILQMELEKHKQAYSDLEKVLTFDNVPDETKEFCLNCINNEKKIHKENADRRNRILMGVGLGLIGAAALTTTTMAAVDAAKHGTSLASTSSTIATNTSSALSSSGGGADVSNGNSALHPATSQSGAQMTRCEAVLGNGRELGDVAYYQDGTQHVVLYKKCTLCKGTGSYCKSCSGMGIKIVSQKWKSGGSKKSASSSKSSSGNKSDRIDPKELRKVFDNRDVAKIYNFEYPRMIIDILHEAGIEHEPPLWNDKEKKKLSRYQKERIKEYQEAMRKIRLQYEDMKNNNKYIQPGIKITKNKYEDFDVD